MKRAHATLAGCVIIVLLAACTKAAPGGAEAQIRELEQHQTVAALAGDRAALLDIFAPHFSLITPAGAVAGRDELLELLGSARPYVAATYITETVRDFGDVVVTTGIEEVEYGPGAQAGQTQKRRVTQVWERYGDGWRLMLRHATLVAQPA